MITILKPILIAFLMSDSVKNLVIELLEAYAKNTENNVDDYAVQLVKQGLGK